MGLILLSLQSFQLARNLPSPETGGTSVTDFASTNTLALVLFLMRVGNI